jgi:hypothetical protein
MRSLAKLIAITVLATTPAAIAGAQGVTSMTKPFSLGISGGVAIPTGDLSNVENTGYNVTGHIGYGNPTFPFQLRGDIGYNGFSAKSSACPSGSNCDAHALGFTGNLVYEFPTAPTQVRPYLMGGAGVYNVKFEQTATTGNTTFSTSTSENDFGFNLGGGFVIPLSGFNAFVEAKYTQVNSGGTNLKFVPITFGVMF